MRLILLALFCVATLPVVAKPPGAAVAGAVPDEIGFTLEDAHIVVQAELEPGQPLPFLFDSGLSRGHLITPAAAAMLGLQGGKTLGFQSAEGERREAADVQVAQLRIGTALLRDQPFAILALPPAVIARADQPPLAGMLGAPLLAQAVLCIDYGQRVLRRWSREDFDDRGWTVVPMTIERGLPIIEVDIDGEPARLIVDTGNNGAIVVHAAFAARANFAQRYPPFTVGSAHSGGAAFETRWGEAERVTIAPEARLRAVPLMVMPAGSDPGWGVDGMLGFQLLSMLDPCLDRDGGRFMFRRR